ASAATSPGIPRIPSTLRLPSHFLASPPLRTPARSLRACFRSWAGTTCAGHRSDLPGGLSAKPSSGDNTHVHLLPGRIHSQQFAFVIEQHREAPGGAVPRARRVAGRRARRVTEGEHDCPILLAPPWLDVQRTDQEPTGRDGHTPDRADEAPGGH